MDKKTISNSLISSIQEPLLDSAENILEIGIDSILEEGILKDVPFISTAISLYKIGKGILDRHTIKKFAIFINEINNHTIKKEKINEYKKKIESNIKKSEQELEYLLIILARYIGYEKPSMLSKIYLAYLESDITWDNLVLFSEIIDRLLPGDFNELASAQTFKTESGIGDHIMLRLEALGLIIEEKEIGAFTRINNGFALTKDSFSKYTLDKKERTYIHTDLGNALVNILGWKIKK